MPWNQRGRAAPGGVDGTRECGPHARSAPALWTHGPGTVTKAGRREAGKGTAPVGGTTGAVDAPGPGGERPVRRSLRPLRGASGSIMCHRGLPVQPRGMFNAQLPQHRTIPQHRAWRTEHQHLRDGRQEWIPNLLSAHRCNQASAASNALPPRELTRGVSRQGPRQPPHAPPRRLRPTPRSSAPARGARRHGCRWSTP